METTDHQPDPSHIMKIGMGFFTSKVLLTAVNEGLFTHLVHKPQSINDIKKRMNWNCTDRHAMDFLDTLHSLGFLNREGVGLDSIYSNSLESNVFLDEDKNSYIGGMLKMANNRLFRFWADLDLAIKTGEAQNESKHGDDIFEAIYSDHGRLKEFIHAMTGVQMGNFVGFANSFDFTEYKTLCDIGGSGATLSIQVALHQPHMSCTSLDLPPVEPIANENIQKFKVADRVKAISGDFFVDDFPKADVIVMGNILHDWGMDKKQVLIKKAYDALPENGAFVVIENIIDNERSNNIFGMTMSLNMLIETQNGFDYTLSDFDQWTSKAGFSSVELLPLAGPSSAAIAYK